MSTRRNNGSPFELLIFDCDGVLVDSEWIVGRARFEALQAIGYSLSHDAVADRFTGVSDKDMYAALEADLGRSLPATFAIDLNRREAALYERELRPVNDVVSALAQLRMTKCVASGSTPATLALKLRATALEVWFDGAVFSSAMVARGKPAADLFLYAAVQMQIRPERCLVIEDSAWHCGCESSAYDCFRFRRRKPLSAGSCRALDCRWRRPCLRYDARFARARRKARK